MERRRFLEFAGRLGAGLGIAGPLLGPEALHALSGFASAARSNKSPNLAMSLDGNWLISTDPNNTGREEKWWLSPRSSAKTTMVPSIIQEAFPTYHGVVWYWRSFQAEANPHPAGRYLLRFNAVDYLADVWLNGVHLGSHEGGETPFVFDATSAIRPGPSNSLSVRVLNPTDKPI